jgi:hypothetical protein
VHRDQQAILAAASKSMGKEGNEARAEYAVRAAAGIGAMTSTMAGQGGSEGL